MTAIFSVRLDETGTNGTSPYVVVAGGVGTLGQWGELERRWNALLGRRNVRAFHSQEFGQEIDDFQDWGDLKCARFIAAQEKIIRQSLLFSIAVAVEKATHADVKARMKGVRNFKSDSDYGLCFRVIRYLTCDKIRSIVPGSKVQFLVEDGPFAADAAVIYQEVRATHGAKYRPARHAEMMDGFASAPKGRLRSLEAADYLAGRAISDLDQGILISRKRTQQLSLLMDREFLLTWHGDMLKEKERRHSHAMTKRGAKPTSS